MLSQIKKGGFNTPNIIEQKDQQSKLIPKLGILNSSFLKKKIFGRPSFIAKKFDLHKINLKANFNSAEKKLSNKKESLISLDNNFESTNLSQNIFTNSVDSSNMDYNDYEIGPKYSKTGELIKYSILGKAENFNNSSNNIKRFKSSMLSSQLRVLTEEIDNNDDKFGENFKLFSKRTSFLPPTPTKFRTNNNQSKQKSLIRKNIQSFSKNQMLRGFILI